MCATLRAGLEQLKSSRIYQAEEVEAEEGEKEEESFSSQATIKLIHGVLSC